MTYVQGGEFKFHLIMQRIAVKYIKTSLHNFIWLKPCDIRNSKNFVKHFCSLIPQVTSQWSWRLFLSLESFMKWTLELELDYYFWVFAVNEWDQSFESGLKKRTFHIFFRSQISRSKFWWVFICTWAIITISVTNLLAEFYYVAAP